MGDDESAAGKSDREVRFGYFVVQARAKPAGDAIEVRGIVENLTTGEKRAFHTVGEMARLLDEWAERGAAGGPR